MRAALGWLPALLQMALIFFLSSLRGDQVHLPDFPASDKVAHAGFYGLLGALIALRGGFAQKFSGKKVGAWTLGGWTAPGLGFLYGVSDEFHQLFVPGREFSLWDMAADAIGVTAGFWLLRAWDRRRLRNRLGD